MRIISAIMNFYLCHVIAFKYCPMKVPINLVEFERKQEFSSIRSLRMRIILAVVNFYLCHVTALQIVPHERSDKFS